MPPDTVNHIFVQNQPLLSEREIEDLWTALWRAWRTSETWEAERAMGSACSAVMSINVVSQPLGDCEIAIKVGRTFGMHLVTTYNRLPCRTQAYDSPPLPSFP